MISNERIKQLAAEAFPGYQRQDTDNRQRVERAVRAALTEAAVAGAGYQPFPLTCPNGCGARLEGRLSESGIDRLRCLKCDTRWTPKPPPRAP
jgi:hypothetical protein